MLRSRTRVDFSQYKPTTLKRRMAFHDLENLAAYQHYLQAQPAELEALHQEILINVTSFFRDAEAFEALKTEVFPALLRGRDRHDPIRIWVAGCSTGEEAYSIAICWLEYLAYQTFNQPIQIFATDIISEAAVEAARRGIYREAQIADVAPDRLQRFFVAVEQGYQVNSTVRELCIFARQNLTSDPPFSQLDLVSCRNVLIYSGSALQAKVLPMFHYGLKNPWLFDAGVIRNGGRLQRFIFSRPGSNADCGVGLNGLVNECSPSAYRGSRALAAERYHPAPTNHSTTTGRL
ncbi:MAG: CheR family methyltransferase [Leptolyngbyaceae cyanobacterium]